VYFFFYTILFTIFAQLKDMCYICSQ